MTISLYINDLEVISAICGYSNKNDVIKRFKRQYGYAIKRAESWQIFLELKSKMNAPGFIASDVKQLEPKRYKKAI